MGSIERRVIAIVAELLRVDEESVTLDASIADDLGADSLYAIEVIMALEDEFELTISDEDAERIKTVWQAIAYVKCALR